MIVGKGVQYFEMFFLLKIDEENLLEFFQIWLNFLKKDKFVDFYFVMFWWDMILVYEYIDDVDVKIKVMVIVGKINGV